MYRVRTTFGGVAGSPWISTMYFDEAGGTPANAVTAVGTFWNAVDSLMETSVVWATLADVETVQADTGNVTAVETTIPQTGNGVAATTGLPIASQMLVRWRTGVYVAGREVRGRTFIPGLATAVNSDGVPSGSAQTTVNNAASALVGALDAQLVVWSRTHGQARVVTVGSVWNQFAVLRSRRD